MTLDELEKLCAAFDPEPKEYEIHVIQQGKSLHVLGPPRGYYNEAFRDGLLMETVRTMLPKLLKVAKAAKKFCDDGGYGGFPQPHTKRIIGCACSGCETYKALAEMEQP